MEAPATDITTAIVTEIEIMTETGTEIEIEAFFVRGRGGIISRLNLNLPLLIMCSTPKWDSFFEEMNDFFYNPMSKLDYSKLYQ